MTKAITGRQRETPVDEFRTELVFVLDASGSMFELTSDTIGGFNSMIEKNREEPGEVKVSTVVFNDSSKIVHDRVDISDVSRLTSKEYRCSGCTALLDAIGTAIERQAAASGALTTSSYRGNADQTHPARLVRDFAGSVRVDWAWGRGQSVPDLLFRS